MDSTTDLRTKYRPKRFEDVIGQAGVVRSLKSVLDARSTHAFLLTGPPGTGKTTLARLIAETVGCDRRNMTEVNGAHVTGVDAMRELANTMMFSGFGKSPVKVAILDEAHRLSAQAWSCLLKPIEEPPKHAYWIFCTSDASKVPKAILTRCPSYETKSVQIDDLYELLVDVAEAEKLTTSEDVLFLIAQKSDGSPRQALSNLVKCHTCKDRKSALRMLKEIEVEGDANAVLLCRGLLVGNLDWTDAMKLVKAIADTNPESVRQVVLNYFYKVATDAGGDKCKTAVAVLDAFAVPYPPSNNLYPVILSLANLLL